MEIIIKWWSFKKEIFWSFIENHIWQIIEMLL